MKILKKLGIVLLTLLIIAQFFGPEKNQGDLASVNPFIEETNPPVEVQNILKNTCFDCHSNNTIYPWYSNITPVNYWLADHVNEGKEELNFSNWNSYSLKKKEHKMDELYEEVAEEEMPLNSYTWTHADARLSQEQIDAIVTWGKSVKANYEQQMSEE